MLYNARVWIGRLFFWLLVSWVFPFELLTCRGFGERYADGRRAALSLCLLLAIALEAGFRKSWLGMLPVLAFTVLAGIAYIVHRTTMGNRNGSPVPRNPWSWGIPPSPFRGSPYLFWLVAQPLLALAFGIASLFFSWELALYFILAAPSLWIFRKLAPPVLTMSSTPWSDADVPNPGEIDLRAQSPFLRAERARTLSPTTTPVSDAPPLVTSNPPRSRQGAYAIGLLCAGAALGLVLTVLALRWANGALAPTKDDIFPSCVRSEEERLAAILPGSQHLPVPGFEKETPLSEDVLRNLLAQNGAPLLQRLKRSWVDQPVYLISGDFFPRASTTVRLPAPGIVVEWIPWTPHRAGRPNAILLLYLETRPEATEELQRVLAAAPEIPPFHFGPQSRLVLFDVTRAGKLTVLHCLSARSFSFRIGDFTLSQTLSESDEPRNPSPP